MTEVADLVIIGGGITGVSIAFRAIHRRAGKIILLEASTLACAGTGMSTGVVRQFYLIPELVRMGREGIEWYSHFPDFVDGVPHIERFRASGVSSDCRDGGSGLRLLRTGGGIRRRQSGMLCTCCRGTSARRGHTPGLSGNWDFQRRAGCVQGGHQCWRNQHASSCQRSWALGSAHCILGWGTHYPEVYEAQSHQYRAPGRDTYRAPNIFGCSGSVLHASGLGQSGLDWVHQPCRVA